MNLHEQLGALEAGVDQLIQAVVAPQAQNIPETGNESTAQEAPADKSVPAAETAAEQAQTAEPQAGAAEEAAAPAAPPLPTLEINRPAQNEITMTIGGQTVALRPEQVGKLIEELSNARASMTPEPPPGIPPGWRFVSTKNPVMAVQKQSNGDRLLVMRHTGHGWVPFTFSPDMVIQLYMMLTNK
ncbi:MAG: Putative tail fiber protein [uncultured Paraburkholderia sp.]|nr:MAG: Putative tail fiber protein [uncultured Paraburkholderia sp.]